MSFSADIEKPSNEKFFLAEILARVDIGNGTSIGGNNYTFEVGSINVAEVYVNGQPATSFSLVDGLLTVNSTEDLTNSSNFIIIDRAIYVTGTKARVSSGVAGIPDAEWEPRITTYPTFSQSMRDITEGVFSLSSSELNILSTDSLYRDITRPAASLSKAPVRIWMCLNSLENNRLVFTGEVTNCRFKNSVITLGLSDSFKKLSEVATFGPRRHSFEYAGNPDRPYIDADNENIAVPITFGYGSPFSVRPGWRHLDAYGTPIGPTWHVTGGLKAVKYSPETPGPTDTVSYSAGRISGSILRLNFGTISNCYEHIISRKVPRDPSSGTYGDMIDIFDRIYYLQCSYLNCQIGDYIPQLNGFVCQVGNYGFGSYNLAVASPGYGADLNANTPPSSGLIAVPSIPNNTIPAMSVWMDGGDQVLVKHIYILLGLNPDNRYTSHSTRYLPFTPSFSTYTHAGSTITNVTFTVNPTTAKLLSSDVGEGSANPLSNKVLRYCYRLASPENHALTLKFFLRSAGMDTNSASFTQAESDLSAQMALTLPLDKGQEHNTYLTACQAVTSSTFGLLGVNEDNEVEYKVLNSLSIANGIRDKSDILADSASASIEYQDIATKIKFQHAEIDPLQVTDNVTTTGYVESARYEFLQRSSKIKVIKHYLRFIDNVIARFAGYFKNPIIEYNISTASKDLNSSIGDVLEVTNSVIATDTGTVKAVVTQLDTSTSRTDIKLNELRGV